jgi:hypothetical protein
MPWQLSMMAALRGQAATWGGSANLVVPWTEDLLERPELWAIAAALDPDVIAVARPTLSDFAGLVPGGYPEPEAADEVQRIGRDGLEAVLRAFGQRLPILQRNGKARPLFADASGIRFPCTPVAAVAGDLGPASALRCTRDLDLGLALAADAGDLAEAGIEALARRAVVVTPYDLEQDEARERVLRGPRRPGSSGAWALAETGLRWLSPVTRDRPTASVIVGDDAWDFAVGYALRRLTSLAWWLPTSLLADPFTVPWLLHRIDEIGHGDERCVVGSVSDEATSRALAQELSTASSDSRDWVVADNPVDPLRGRPARLLSRVPGLETFALQDGATGFLPPDLPDVGEAFGQRIYWMSEILGENWQPLPDARLATSVIQWPAYDSASARTTHSGAAYLCPHFIRMSDDMESEVVRPKIAVLGLREQLQKILAEHHWRLEPSDKGQYAEGAARLFGGDDELRSALSAPSWWKTLRALTTDAAPNEQRGWKLPDRRTYYELAEVEAIRGETGLETSVLELLTRRILLRGFVFRCPVCRLKGWYGADELADRLRCARCREPFALTDHGWQPATEPQWRYRLNELLWQLLTHNGDIPLRALRQVLGIGTPEMHEPAASLHEHDLWEPDNESPVELDICAQRGAELWIGEAKTASSLGQGQDARRKLEGIRRAAEVMRPHGILFVTASDAWTDRTQEVASAVLGELPSELRFASCPRPA